MQDVTELTTEVFGGGRQHFEGKCVTRDPTFPLTFVYIVCVRAVYAKGVYCSCTKSCFWK